MKVLVATTPGAGHVHPVVPVAALLRDAGHQVLWATGPDAVERIRGFGFDTVVAGLSLAERGARLPALGLPLAQTEPRARRRLIAPALFVTIAAPPMIAALGPVFDDFAPDLVVNEPGELASAPLARAHGLPHVTVGFGDLMPPAVLEALAPGVTDLWASVDLPPPVAAGYFDHLYLHPFPEGLGQATTFPTIRRARPAAFDAGTDDPPAWILALGRERPLVYVTFGTEFAGQAPFASLFEALAEVDADAVLTTGDFDHAAVPPAPRNVRIEHYLPQRFLLDRAAAVVSQAGSGVLIGAALAGLPQVSIPLGADQFDNADALAATGAGVTVEGEVDSAILGRAVERALTDPDQRSAARRLAEDFAALPEPARFLEEIEALAAR